VGPAARLGKASMRNAVLDPDTTVEERSFV
jgi:hypothetical protein